MKDFEKFRIEDEEKWRPEIEQLIDRLREENYSKVTIEFENWSAGSQLRTDLSPNIELTDEETSALEWFCWHISLRRGVVEIEPKTRKLKLMGNEEKAIAPVSFQF